MINKKTINEVRDKLVKAYNPLEIYLFGSYAWGKPNKDSDLDLLIIVKKSYKHPIKRPIKGYHVLYEMLIPKDILVYTEKEFNANCDKPTSLLFKIKRDGKKIYARA